MAIAPAKSGNIIYPCNIFMPPTSKKLEGHIASGTFVRACVRPSVCPSVTLFGA